MRRIVSACLEQTMRFDTTNGANSEMDFDLYVNKLNKSGTKYEVIEKNKEADGTIIIKIKKQYNAYSTEGYLE